MLGFTKPTLNTLRFQFKIKTSKLSLPSFPGHSLEIQQQKLIRISSSGQFFKCFTMFHNESALEGLLAPALGYSVTGQWPWGDLWSDRNGHRSPTRPPRDCGELTSVPFPPPPHRLCGSHSGLGLFKQKIEFISQCGSSLLYLHRVSEPPLERGLEGG